MRTLEEQVCPPATEHPAPRDLIVISLLLLLSLLLPALPAWVVTDQTPNQLIAQAFSVYLLPALGMLLALRLGVIDLGVWAWMALGGLVAAWLINLGTQPEWALLAGTLSGAAPGLACAFLTGGLKVPAPLATVVVGMILVWTCQYVSGHREVAIPDGTFDRWHMPVRSGDVEPAHESAPGEPGMRMAPLADTRKLLVGLAYAFALFAAAWHSLIAMVRHSHTHREPAPHWPRSVRLRRGGLLVISGLLSAGGGALWLIERGRTPIPSQLIGDLRIPVAAVLAGGIMLAGRNRTILSIILLPPAMLMGLMWRQNVWPMFWNGLDVQMGVLLALALLMHGSCILAWLHPGPGRRSWIVAAAAAVLAVAIMAATTIVDQRVGSGLNRYAWRQGMYAATTILAGAAVIALLWGAKKVQKEKVTVPRS